MLNEVLLLKNVVEICANCGKIRRKPKEAFKCTECGSDVCIVVPYPMFKQMVETGAAKE
jgi:DNA-directed RNA polymerase subunit RPC12/RpoP